MTTICNYEVIKSDKGQPNVNEHNTYTISAPEGKVLLSAGAKRTDPTDELFSTVGVEMSDDGVSCVVTVVGRAGSEATIWAVAAEKGVV